MNPIGSLQEFQAKLPQAIAQCRNDAPEPQAIGLECAMVQGPPR